MIRRVLAQLLIGLVLAGSSPVSRPAASEARPVWVPAPAVAPAPPVAPPETPTSPVVSEEISISPDESSSSAVHLAEGATIEALPVDVRRLLQDPEAEGAEDASLAPLRLTTDRPVPGIQKEVHSRAAGRAVQEVQPPLAPQAVVAEAPDEYAAVAARADESAPPARPRLTVRPAILRFALTRDGVIPAAQSLEISSDRRAGARFEVAGSAGWLVVEAGRGRAGLAATAVRVAVDGRKVAGPLSGQLEVRNLDDLSDVQRIAVEVERAEPGRLLRSHDAAGRLQRVVRPDGGILDYDYDARGNLVRVRRPDGSAVTWSYDDLGRRIAMTDGRGTTVYRYDSHGRLDAVYTPGFEPVRYGYDERSRLTTLHLPGGKVVAWEYDDADRLLAVRSDLGTTRYTYDTATSQLAERVLPNGVATRYGYDAAGRLTGVTHLGASGEPLLSFSWSLDAQGRPVRVTRESSAGAETTDLSYDAAGRVASVASSTGRVMTYDYDDLGRRTRTVETLGSKVQVTDYAYDDLGRLARAGDEVFVYDAVGALVRRVTPDRTLEYRWDFEGRLTGFRDGRHAVEYAVDGDGRRVGMTVDGREVSRLHDASGWIGGVLAEANVEGDVLRTHVHGFEPIAVERQGEGSFYLYDHPLRSAAALVSPSGALAETFVSDPFGAPQAPPDAALPPYLFAGGEYDSITGLIHRNGAEYDPRLGAFLPSAFENEGSDGASDSPAAWGEQAPAGAFSEALVKAFRPDRPLPADPGDEPTAGRTSGQDPPAGSTAPLHVTIFQSNELPPASERTKTHQSALPSHYRLAPEAGSVYRRGELPAARELAAPRLKLHPEYLPFVKTASGILPSSQTIEVASSDGQALSFSAQEDISWLSVSSTGGTAPATLTVTVDPAGLTEQGSPYVGDIVLTNTSDATDVRKVRVRLLVLSTGAFATLHSFDANGNLRRLIKPDGAIIDFEVDSLGRVTRVRYPGQPAVSYAYDGNGNRISMTDQRGTTVYQYDQQNRLTGVLTPLGSDYIPVYYSYDNAGRLTRLATPDGRTVFYQYDADGRLIRVIDGADVTTYTYAPVTGLPASQTLPNGITTTYTYDADGRLTDVVHKTPDNALLMGFHYTLNALGQRTSVTRQTPGSSELTTYSYDALGRLASVTYPDSKIVSYTYDPVGNRLSMTTVLGGNTTVVNYEYDRENRLLRAGDEVFQHDANGNLIRRSSPARTTTYAYDARNLLTRVETEDRVVTFEYDGDGNRVARESNGLRTNFINDDSGDLSHVLVEASASWQVLRSYSYGVRRIGSRTGSAGQIFLDDGASTVALTAGDASFIETYTYDAFGKPSTPSVNTAYLYDGEAFDAEISLFDLEGRYYDPGLGRLLSSDSVPGEFAWPAGRNEYAFVENDPVNFAAPDGFKPEPKFRIIVEFGFFSPGGGIKINDVFNLDVGVRATIAPEFVFGSRPISSWLYIPTFEKLKITPNIKGGISLQAGNRKIFLKVDALKKPHFEPGIGLHEIDWASTNISASVQTPLSPIGFGARFTGKLDLPFSVSDAVRDLVAWAWSSVTSFFQGGSSLYQPTGPPPDLLPEYRLCIFCDPPPPGLGGVSLNKTADLLLSLQDITGATFDEATGQIVLLGRDDISLPPLDMNHVSVATQSVYSGEDPAVSIDLPIVNNQMSVRFEGQTRNTRFGDVMFEADRVLKILTLGKDNVTGQPVSSAVPGYKNMLQRRLEAGCNSVPNTTRMWFQPKEVRLVPSTDGKSMIFDAVSMELLYESKVGNQVVSDPQAAAFASHFTQNYAAFASEWPILQKLEQLGKIVAIIKWIKDNRTPIDLSFLDNFPIEFFSTAIATPAVTVQGSTQSGSGCTVTIQGGVTYEVPNQYLPADPAAGAALSEALAERPSEETFKWTYQPSEGAAARFESSGPVTAVAESLTRSRRDGNVRFQEIDLSDPLPGGGALALLRTYNSFLDTTGPLGPGWSVLPAELRFPLKKERFTFGSSNLALDLYARIWVTERMAGREDAYDLLGIDSSNLPVYRRADAMHVFRQQGDGTFRLTREDGSAATFRADGKPLSLVDRNGNAVSFVYDAQVPDRLLRLTAADGRAIDLSYDAQGRLFQSSGPDGRQVLYDYDTQGRLTTVTDFAGRSRAYGYDSTGRLAAATDAEGRSIFAAGYDDYDRTPTRRVGAAAQYGLGFDLETGQSTVVDPLGRTSRQTLERRQLASPSGIRNEVYRPKESEDPLGNRATITWADDAFGPRTVTDTQGATTELAWDNRGHLTTVRDPLGGQTERFYDWRDRLVAVCDAEGLATAFGYDDKNNPITVYHNVILNLDAEGTLTSFSYDPSNVSTFTYDANGNVTSATNPLGHSAQVENNAKGQPTRVTSPSGVVTALGYDARSRMTSAQTGGRQVTYGYDAADQMTSVTTAAGTTSFDRDPQGRMTRLTDALSGSTLFSYDTDGNLTRVEDALDGVATYTYDALGHLLSASLPNGTSNAWDYDELGRPVAALTGLGPVAPALALTVESLDFGTVAVGTSRERSLDLYNQGTAPLTVSGISVSAPFFVAFSGPATIQPAGSLRVTVTFTPTDQVPESANLSITSDDPETPLELVALSGDGTRRVVNLQATPTLGGIRLTWDPFEPGGQAFARFHIYRSTSPIPGSVAGLTPINTSLTDPATTTFVDTTATAGVPYHYAVTARFANGFEDPNVDPAGPVAFFDASTTFGGIGRSAVAADGARHETWPAAVYNSAADEYLLVYEWDEAGDGSNLDVYGQRLSAGGARLGAPFAIAAGAEHEQRPQVGYSSVSDEYLVIFERATSATNFDIYGRRVSAAGAPVSTAFAIGATTVHDRRPQLAYNPAGNQYLVVYDRDSAGNGSDLDVAGRRVSGTGAVVGGEFFIGNILINGVPVHDRNPHVTWNGTAQEYLVAYEADRNDDGTNFDIVGQRVSATGTITGSPKFLASFLYGGQPGHELSPHLAHDSVNNQYMMAFEVDRNRDGQNPDVYVRKFRFDAAGEPVVVVTLAQALANSTLRETAPRVGYSPVSDENAVVWTVESSPGNGDIRAQRIKINNSNFLIASAFFVSAEAVTEGRPALAFDGESNRYLAVWEHDNTAAGTGFDLRLRHLGYSTPLLEVVPTALDFGTTLTDLPLTVSNVGPGTLAWTASTSQAWLSTLPASGSVVASGSSNVSVRADRSGLSPGSYAGTVRISSSGGEVDVAVTMTVANSPPDPPSQPSPADGAANQVGPTGLPALVLTWQGSDPNGDSLTYSVYLSPNASLVNDFTESARIAQGLATPSIQPAGLAFLTQYFWRVVATDTRGASTAGPVWRFTTAAVPAPALLPVAPDPTRETRPALGWQSVIGAASYHLQVADNAEFSPNLVDATGLTATSFTPASALPEGTIYWRVRSLDASGQPGAFSASDTFVIDTTAAGIPVLVPVTPDPANNPQPTLAWSAVIGASSYRVQVAGTPGFTDPFLDATVATLAYQPASDLPEGSIYWRAASLDAAGNQSAFSGADLFTLDTTPPPAITGLTAHRQGAAVHLAWQPLAGPPSDFARFRIYRAEAPFTNVTGITLLNESLTSAAAVSFQDVTASPGVAYWYAVTAVDTAENENREVMTAHVLANEPPAEPVLVAPAVGAQVLPSGAMAVTLAWSASDPENDPLRFDVYLSTDQTQVDGTPDITARIAESLETPSFEAPGLTYQKTYYWRVAALDLAADGSVRSATFGPLWSFAIPAIPAPVLTALAPDPSNQLRPTFTWQSVPGAAGYRIEIATDPSFGSTLVATEVTETSFTPAADLPEGSLHWRVRAIDAQGLPGAFSAVDDFVLDATAPAVPVLVPVTPDPTNNPRPLLGWAAIADVLQYRVQVSSEPGFTTLLVDTVVSINSYQPVSDLPEGRIYWRVASLDGAGNQSAFSTSSFLADRTPPPAVVGLRADWASPGTRLVWEPFPASVTDLALLRVYRSTAPMTDVTGRTPLAILTDPLATSFADTAAAHGIAHHYAVTAVDHAGNELRAVTSVATPPPGGDLYTLSPCRILDTRNAQGPYGGPALVNGQPRSFALAGRCGIPATATAIVGNLAVFSPPADGFLKGYEGGVASPNASALFFATNIVRANNVVLKVQGDGTGTLVLEAVLPAGVPVNVFLDVSGYFE